MKKIIFLVFASFLMYPNADAQVLYNETFDNYTIGNLDTDPSGIIPGQGGWVTECYNCPQIMKDNTRFTINSEPNWGKVLAILSPSPLPIAYSLWLQLKKTDLNLLIDQRTQGKNVIKWEFDYYTGPQYHDVNQRYDIGLTNDSKSPNNFNSLASFFYNPESGSIIAMYHDGKKRIGIPLNNNNDAKIPFNSWIKFNVYLDYTNKKIYFETPYLKTVAVGDFLNLSTSSNLIQDFKPTTISFIMRTTMNNTVENITKYDNIKLTALQNVPPEVLSTNTFLSEKFNLFPNPATEIVNITNNEQMKVKEVEIYDTAGKLTDTQTFNDQTEIQLNISALNSGTYLLHIQTNEGIAVKKLVKN